MKHSLSVVIVSRGQEGLLRSCIQCVERSASDAGISLLEIVVVDNASPRPYGTELLGGENLRIIRFDTHQSFSHACNRGACGLDSESILFLNNDVFLEAQTLRAMAESLQSSSVGISGAWLYFSDGRIQHRGVVFGAHDVGPYHIDRGRYLEPREAEEDFQAVTGACLMVRRVVFEELSGFDESFAFGLEDVDFCLRARQHGYRVSCVSAGRSLHFESLTPGRSELDVPSRALFMDRWRGKYSIDG